MPAWSPVRSQAARYILINEVPRRPFRPKAPPSSGSRSCPLAETPEQLALVRRVAQAFRAKDAEKYMTMADDIEKEFSLRQSTGDRPAEHLGRVDTFRFEEKVLLSHARAR